MTPPSHTSRALLEALSHHASEHFPTASYGVFPPSNSTSISTSTSGSTSTSTVALLLVSNRYSPQNFWNGRWRSLYHLPLPLSSSPAVTPALSSPASTTTAATAANPTLTGSIKLDVHYYEDGNVRLQTTKPISLPLANSGIAIAIGPSTATQIMRQIAQMEKKYQEELNRAFGSLSEGAFKALRRQLPVTRRKVEWERVGGYKVCFLSSPTCRVEGARST